MSEGWLMSGKTLYKVDLTTGKGFAGRPWSQASRATVRDIAAMPKAM